MAKTKVACRLIPSSRYVERCLPEMTMDKVVEEIVDVMQIVLLERAVEVPLKRIVCWDRGAGSCLFFGRFTSPL